MSVGHRHLLSRALPKLNETWSKPKELLAGWSQGRASFIPNEKRAPKLLLKQAHARADGRLSDMQTLGGLNKTPGRNDLYKGPGELDVHFLSSIKHAGKCQLNSFACFKVG
jgi:hypothetical protein